MIFTYTVTEVSSKHIISPNDTFLQQNKLIKRDAHSDSSIKSARSLAYIFISVQEMNATKLEENI